MSLTTTDEPTLVNRDQSAGNASENQTLSTQPTANSQATQVDQLMEVDLPETLVIIEPSSSWVALNLREMWVYRELLFFLTWRDIKIRYKQTALGALWAIIQPLFTMLIFSTVASFTGLAQKTGGVPYPLATYAALVPWIFFANAVTNSGNSLIGSANLISKVYFPRMLVPAASIVAALLDFAIAFVFLLPLAVFYRGGLVFSSNLLMLPVLIFLIAVLALGVGMWMSALNVKFRDIRYALPFLIQLGMFASPIYFWLNIVPAKWQPLFLLNPLTGIIEGFRSALFGLPFHWMALGVSSVITMAMLVYALYAFRRMEQSFADII